MSLLDVRPDQLKVVQDILHRHVPQYEVWAFGSRAKWMAKDYSDLDLCIKTDAPLGFDVLAQLQEDFTESDLPWKVDVVDWAVTSATFRQIIERDKVVLQEHARVFVVEDEWKEEQFGIQVLFVSDKSKVKDANINTYISTENMLVNFGGVTAASSLPLTGSVTKFKAGDTLFSNIRTYFKKVWQARFNGCCSNDVLVFRAKNREVLLPNYLHQICRWEKFIELSIRTSKGAKMPRGDKEALASFKFHLPDIAEQRAIAQILGSLDDKIELNRRLNHTLEAMARALFKSWFVDFDGVSPEDMQKSELGLVPKGWRVGALSDLAVLNPEVWTKHTRPNEIRYVDLSSTKWGRIESVMPYLVEDAPSRAQRVLRPGDTIVGTVRPGNGSYALVAEDGLTGSTGFAVLRPKRNEYSALVYLAATEPDNIEALANLADGGAYPAVRAEVVAATVVVIADKETINAFSLSVSPLLEKMAGNERQSQTLAALRDTLLPRLISGELRIQDVESLIEAA